MIRTLLLLLYVTLILTVIFVERKSPTEALLWVIVLVCLPYFGAVLYLIFGSTTAIKLTSFFRKRRLRKRLPAAAAPQELLHEAELSEEDRQVIRFNSVYNQSKLTCYEDAQIFTTGESHYRALFQDIKEAKECIYIEFYTIHHDVMG